MPSGTLVEQVINGCNGFYPSLPDIAIAFFNRLHGCRVAEDLDCVNKGFEIFPLHHVRPDLLDLLVDLINRDTRAHDHTCALLLIIIWEGDTGPYPNTLLPLHNTDRNTEETAITLKPFQYTHILNLPIRIIWRKFKMAKIITPLHKAFVQKEVIVLRDMYSITFIQKSELTQK